MDIRKKQRKGIVIIIIFLLIYGLSAMEGKAAEGGYREFLNDRNRPKADYSGDKREVFHIVEVIPHDACSIFPYLIDWKTEEEYNRNLPIGYEGLIFGSTHSGNVQIFESIDTDQLPTRPYALITGGIQRDFLTNYEITFTDINHKGTGHWWREIAKDNTKSEIVKTGNGYFEYVGENNGLYYIDTKTVKENGENGISYEMRALPRNGTEKGKGEYGVKDSRYYWAKDYSGSKTYPTKDILSQTNFNYDLIFEAGETDGEGTYKVYSAAEESGDYYAKLTEGSESNYKFESYKGGNYVKKDTEYVYVGIGQGNYIVEKKVVASAIANSQLEEIGFEYAGEGKGIYDVTFIYAGNVEIEETLYTVRLQKVSNGMGRYALTSASKSNQKITSPSYELKENGDYGKIIINIDFAGLDYTDKDNGYYATKSPYSAGVRIGRSEVYVGVEVGSWVFHEMSSISEEEYTKLTSVTDKSTFTLGDRIYVTGQKLIYRYYCRNSFQNNEWFKLLCYFNNPSDSDIPYSNNENGQGYDIGISSSKNLVKAKKLLDEFDHNNRIEIIQRTPGALTKEEVESADLIYISDNAGIESLTQCWNSISQFLEENGQLGLKPLPPGVSTSIGYRFDDDLSNDALLAIYDKCIYTREAALMVNGALRHNYMEDGRKAAEKNLGKLVFFMDLMYDAQDFKYFINGYEENCDYFNMIHNNGGKDVLGIEVWPKQEKKNEYGNDSLMYNFKREGDSETITRWYAEYFEVPFDSAISISLKDTGSGYEGATSMNKVLEGETKYYTETYAVASFNIDKMMNIWQILHNRQSAGKIVVQITNAKLTFGDDKKRVIYADEFDPNSFLVTYKILLKGATPGMESVLLDTIIFFDDNNNDIYDAGELHYINAQQKYDTEDGNHEKNVRSGFEDASSTLSPKLLDPNIFKRKVVVQASNNKGVSASADVWVIVREGFNLN